MRPESRTTVSSGHMLGMKKNNSASSANLVLLLPAFGFILAAPMFADKYQNALQEGQRLFKGEKHNEAIPALSRAEEAQGPETAKVACACLGFCYDRKGDRERGGKQW